MCSRSIPAAVAAAFVRTSCTDDYQEFHLVLFASQTLEILHTGPSGSRRQRGQWSGAIVRTEAN